MAGLDTNRGAKRARELRAELGIAADADVGCLLTFVEDTLRIPVVVAALPEQIDGCCYRTATDTVVWVNGLFAASRRRFTLAHELGHVRCDHSVAGEVVSFFTVEGKKTNALEVQANSFAAELLAPEARIRGTYESDGIGLDEIVEVCSWSGLSPIAGLYRFNQLGLCRRYEELRAHIQAEWLETPELKDGIAQIEVLPRLSPALAGSSLAALAGGTVSTDAAADKIGCAHHTLAGGASMIGI